MLRSCGIYEPIYPCISQCRVYDVLILLKRSYKTVKHVNFGRKLTFAAEVGCDLFIKESSFWSGIFFSSLDSFTGILNLNLSRAYDQNLLCTSFPFSCSVHMQCLSLTCDFLFSSHRLTRSINAWRLILMVYTKECYFLRRRNMQR